MIPSLIEKPKRFTSYTALTLSVPPDGNRDAGAGNGELYLHLKDVTLGGTPKFSKRIHRAFGHSRLHHVKLNDQDFAALRELLPELFDDQSLVR